MQTQQTDSSSLEMERIFIKWVIRPDDKIVFYFRFPAGLKIKLPKVADNYIPNWGLVRFYSYRRFTLQLIRETKYKHEDELRFPHEQRKIKCARKHFKSMGIDYRPIFREFAEWWRSENEIATQGLLEIGKVEKD